MLPVYEGERDSPVSDMEENSFYTWLESQDDFACLTDGGVYAPLPEDWWVGTADLVGSTSAIAEGRYKTVNMIAAAVISAQINAHGGAAFPYVFGGDGAGFAIPRGWRDRAQTTLIAVRQWAKQEFGMELRIGMMPMSDIRAAGLDVTVARFRAARDVDYAMFSGGGLAWAEAQMKLAGHVMPEESDVPPPDLTGLSCRWSHLPSSHGTILSLVVLPKGATSGPEFARLAQQIVTLAQGLARSGHPAEVEGPGVKWPPKGARLEAHARRRGGGLLAAQAKALFESLVAWVLIKTGLTLGGFDARRYRRVVGENADFRKFDDGLKMTLDCDAATEEQLRIVLADAAQNGIITYGLHTQSEAMLTCIVPSVLSDDHVHFVDGASGGYARAALSIKSGGTGH